MDDKRADNLRDMAITVIAGQIAERVGKNPYIRSLGPEFIKEIKKITEFSRARF
jgi:hypothetical protein